ncbi:MAG TPA: kelch repeat-containing protein, partial [Pseudonocardiaceae bacterium]|nr:kelch repeat-containing protein [Pseudonocardiaceae bacterium]
MRRSLQVAGCGFAAVCALVAGVASPAAAAAGNTWTVASDPHQATGYQTATLLGDGRVLAVGGQGTSAELFNPTTGAWTVAASMHVARGFATVTLLRNGQVLVTGGVNGGLPLASAELYNPATNQWTL